MPALLDDLISGVVKTNPDASPEEIRDGLLYFFSYEVVPEAIQNVELPRSPSPAQLKWDEFRTSRLRKGRRERIIRARRDREKLITNLAYLKFEWNGRHEDSSVAPRFHDATLDLTASFRWRETGSNADVLLPGRRAFQEYLRTDRHLTRDLPFPLSPYSSLIERPEKIPLPIVVLDKEIENKVLLDPIYRRIVGAMETMIRSHESWRSFEFHFLWKRDVELPEWQNMVINVRLGDIDFDTKMVLWDEIDAEVRRGLKDIKNQLPDLKDHIEIINRGLFTSVDL